MYGYVPHNRHGKKVRLLLTLINFFEFYGNAADCITIKLNWNMSREWKCQICNAVFASRSALYLHKRNEHNISKGQNLQVELYCPFCNRKLTTNTAFSVHTKSCRLNPNKVSRPNKFIWTEDMRKAQSEKMKIAHSEGRAFSWADLSKRKEPSYPEKWLIEVLKNEFNLIEGKDYQREVKFHTFSLDFLFPNKMVIEVDGSQHKRSDYQKDCDKRKDSLLLEEGYKELRIDWADCYSNPKKYIKILESWLSGR